MFFNKTNIFSFNGIPRRLDVEDLSYDIKYFKDEFNIEKKTENFIKIEKPLFSLKISKLSDDFYSNILDWYNDNIFYSIGTCLYLINNITNVKYKLYSFKIIITSLKSYNSENIIIGFKSGKFIFFNLNKFKYYKLPSHLARVTNIDVNEKRIFTGSEDKKIRIFDIREDKTQLLSKHTLEVTGIKSNNRCDLLASGGNDNNVFVFDLRTLKCILNYKHTAAIRAISWSTFDFLITGGGTADRNIQIWNMFNLKKENEKFLNSQVCNLYCTKNNKIISTHGYSQNDIKIFNIELNLKTIYPSQENRVIHFSVNKNEDKFVTGCTDSLLKFWKIN